MTLINYQKAQTSPDFDHFNTVFSSYILCFIETRINHHPSNIGNRRLVGLPSNIGNRRLVGLPSNIGNRRLVGLPSNISNRSS